MPELVSFQNPGLIPIEAITTLGVNAKENSNPIGYFGTGLKYAIASLLRTGHDITIFAGLAPIRFSSRKELIRGVEIEFIFMSINDNSWERLGFTTRLGVNWEPWQIFRELYSNTLDEKGVMEFGKLHSQEGFTTIHVSGKAFYTAAQNKRDTFLEGEPIFKCPIAQIFPDQSSSIFYRGIKVATLQKPSALTYNIIYDLDLTEDRTVKYGYLQDHYIQVALKDLADEDLLEKILCSKETYEQQLKFEGQTEEFSRMVLRIAARRGTLAVHANALLNAEINLKERSDPAAVNLSPYETNQIEEALAFLSDIGFHVSQPVVVAKNLGPNIWGMARNGTIYIDRTVLVKGGNILTGTILEEHLHLERGFLDESREFQNYLLDLAISFAREARFNKESISNRPPKIVELDDEIPF